VTRVVLLGEERRRGLTLSGRDMTVVTIRKPSNDPSELLWIFATKDVVSEPVRVHQKRGIMADRCKILREAVWMRGELIVGWITQHTQHVKPVTRSPNLEWVVPVDHDVRELGKQAHQPRRSSSRETRQ